MLRVIKKSVEFDNVEISHHIMNSDFFYELSDHFLLFYHLFFDDFHGTNETGGGMPKI